ncbi:MAG: GGDEF domain-containing protein [Rhodocyclaceae bacterium]|jgi:diguanylate cyclase (GGDEF)-like protein/PAS domain S-box-containing protein|nr:GGDEF domain-containing protein [Rhodocyclaceae bacterium]
MAETVLLAAVSRRCRRLAVLAGGVAGVTAALVGVGLAPALASPGALAGLALLVGFMGYGVVALGARGLARLPTVALQGAPADGDTPRKPDSTVGRVALLAEAESFAWALADSTHGVEALFDMSGRLVWVSPSVETLTGYSREECLACEDVVELVVHDSDRAHARSQGRQAAAGGRGVGVELRLDRRDGQIRWVACHWSPFLGPSGDQTGVRLSVEDIQARKEAEYKFLETVAELRRAQALSEHYLARSGDERLRLAALLNALRLGIVFMDPDQRVQYYNRAALEIWSMAADANLLGMREMALRQQVRKLLRDPEAFLAHMEEEETRDGSGLPFEIHFLDGRVVTEVSSVVEGGEGRGVIGRLRIYEDVTESRRISRKLVELAERDPLTNLFNRRRFHEELERLLAEAHRQGEEVGLVLLDLDGFKPINDRFGHQAGDEVLVTLARELARTVRRNEMFFRLGGDEFAILVPDAHEQALVELARRVVERVAGLTFSFGDGPARVTASVGLAFYPRHGENGERFVAAADAAMYAAKAAGRNRWVMAGDGAAATSVALPPGADSSPPGC